MVVIEGHVVFSFLMMMGFLFCFFQENFVRILSQLNQVETPSFKQQGHVSEWVQEHATRFLAAGQAKYE